MRRFPGPLLGMFDADVIRCHTAAKHPQKGKLRSEGKGPALRPNLPAAIRSEPHKFSWFTEGKVTREQPHRRYGR